MRMAFLSSLVFIVVSNRSDKEMTRIYAGWIVAMMAHVLAFWNRAIHTFIRNAVGLDLPLMFISDHTIAAVMNRACPEPTGFGFTWRPILLEAFGQWTRAGGIVTSKRTKDRCFPFHWSQVALLAQTQAAGSATNTNAAAAIVERWIRLIRMPLFTVSRKCPCLSFCSHGRNYTAFGYW